MKRAALSISIAVTQTGDGHDLMWNTIDGHTHGRAGVQCQGVSAGGDQVETRSHVRQN
jgi:hypothetical protein